MLGQDRDGQKTDRTSKLQVLRFLSTLHENRSALPLSGDLGKHILKNVTFLFLGCVTLIYMKLSSLPSLRSFVLPSYFCLRSLTLVSCFHLLPRAKLLSSCLTQVCVQLLRWEAICIICCHLHGRRGGAGHVLRHTDFFKSIIYMFE